MNDIIEEIERIVKKNIKYLANYIGEVKSINDGYIEVSIPDLGWDEAGNYAKCKPDFNISSAITPEVGDYVFIKFISADADRPVYTGIYSEISDLPVYDKDKRVIFEDRSTSDFIKYDRQNKKLEININDDINIQTVTNAIIDGAQIQLNGTANSLVMYSPLNTGLQSLINLINTELGKIATGITGAGGVYTPALVSVDISASEATSLKTDG